MATDPTVFRVNRSFKHKGKTLSRNSYFKEEYEKMRPLIRRQKIRRAMSQNIKVKIDFTKRRKRKIVKKKVTKKIQNDTQVILTKENTDVNQTQEIKETA